MKGLLTKDFLTIKKKYGLPRVIMDIAIIIALMFILEKSGTIYISFLLIPIEIMSMIISLTTCDEQWKWGKYTPSSRDGHTLFATEKSVAAVSAA